MRFDTDKSGYILTTEQLDYLFREREELKEQVENGKSIFGSIKYREVARTDYKVYFKVEW